MLFSGIDNRNQNSISIKLTRYDVDRSEVFMLVTLKHDAGYSTFTLPVNQFSGSGSHCSTKPENRWRAGDLNIWSTIPSRRYRICFNGLLRYGFIFLPSNPILDKLCYARKLLGSKQKLLFLKSMLCSKHDSVYII